VNDYGDSGYLLGLTPSCVDLLPSTTRLVTGTTAVEETPASPVSRDDVPPDQAQVSRRVSTIVRHSETPETILVSGLVRVHTSPGHENGPQAELAGR